MLASPFRFRLSSNPVKDFRTLYCLSNLRRASSNSRRYPRDNLLISPSTFLESSRVCEQFHALAVVLGLSQDDLFVTKIVSSYCKCENVIAARRFFEGVLERNVYVYNAMISGYVKNKEFKEPISLFSEMRAAGFEPDDYTYASMVKVLGEFRYWDFGKGLHGVIFTHGFHNDLVVSNSLVAMYCNYRCLIDAQKVFDEMHVTNIVSCNTLIAGYASCFDGGDDGTPVWLLLRTMQYEGIKIDVFTIASLLDFCWKAEDLRRGKAIHGFGIRNSLVYDTHVSGCLIHMYAKCSKLDLAKHVFHHMEQRNIVAWTILASCYAKKGVLKEAMEIFRLMQLIDGLQPNRVSLISILPACASHGGLLEGREIHGFSIRHSMSGDISLSNALIDMYGKCGKLDYAKHVFDHALSKDDISWSSMIGVYGLHGYAEQAFVLFDEMQQLEINPVQETFLGIITACSRAGFVVKGLEFYYSMRNVFGILPSVEICSCVVDMLGRAGQIERALEFIESMPVKPIPSMWSSLLSASVLHGNHKIGNTISRILLKNEPRNPSNYIALSNSCAIHGEWDKVIEARYKMMERGLSKVTGHSWIAVNS